MSSRTGHHDRALRVSAVILTMGDRPDMLRTVLDRLASAPVDEVLVVDNGSNGTPAVAAGNGVRLIRPNRNAGIAGRNLAAGQARGDLLLMLDDDSYPLPGAVERLRAAFRGQDRLAAAGGLVRDVDGAARVTDVDGVGSFDWFVRAGRSGDASPEGMAADFFAEGGCMLRRSAYLEVGGFFEPYFFTCSEIDLSTRLLAAGWDVRYFPEAEFDHMKPEGHGAGSRLALQYRIRNNAWYYWLRFPPAVAWRRIPAYLLYDLLECAYRRMPGAWVRGIREAWRERESVRAFRKPIPRSLVHRVEINRGRLHLKMLANAAGKRLRRG